MLFVSVPLFLRQPSKSQRIRMCKSNENVQTAKRTLLDAATALNLGRDVVKQPDKLDHVQRLIKNLEAEWKIDKPTNLTLVGRRELVYTTLPDVLAIDRPRWMQCASVFQIIEAGEKKGFITQVFRYAAIRCVISFSFELGFFAVAAKEGAFCGGKVGWIDAL
ncbi:hypothetical protein BWQ96_05515 [Gracilariopsis chorda]|uniref:Plastid lipid-associated protein/fibrillin conserved domain-containing protein n=1 Tax=Gracilariopsis chorda TaxID=448386 RepID=A0A2V3IRK6_9FLOR|nr:hypothetical protein BWQ96_05515 [Gracilariopsis chorda]|eukprot:PXF44756.1 hypothetical protein BWQ96_05515 [Gracilariopsis chorda]